MLQLEADLSNSTLSLLQKLRAMCPALCTTTPTISHLTPASCLVPNLMEQDPLMH